MPFHSRQAAPKKISKKHAEELDQLATLIDELTGGTIFEFDATAKAALHGAGVKTAQAVMKGKSPAKVVKSSKAAPKAAVKKVAVKAAKTTAKRGKVAKSAGHSHDGVPCAGH